MIPSQTAAPDEVEEPGAAEELRSLLNCRLEAHRRRSFAGAVPLVIRGVLGGFGRDLVGELLNDLAERADDVQVMVPPMDIARHGADLLLPVGMADKNDWAAAEAQVPETHKAFVTYLKDKYKVPDPTAAIIGSPAPPNTGISAARPSSSRTFPKRSISWCAA